MALPIPFTLSTHMILGTEKPAAFLGLANMVKPCLASSCSQYPQETPRKGDWAFASNTTTSGSHSWEDFPTCLSSLKNPFTQHWVPQFHYEFYEKNAWFRPAAWKQRCGLSSFPSKLLFILTWTPTSLMTWFYWSPAVIPAFFWYPPCPLSHRTGTSPPICNIPLQ